MQSIEIQLLSSNASTNTMAMKRITNIVNRVYKASEEGLWMHGAVRTSVEEMAEYTSNGEIAVARSMGKIIGCVRVRRLDEETGEFGMLAVDNQFQGGGTGRELIHFAEQKCKKEHLRKMQLELLVPQNGSHPSKSILENWYVRIGYRPVRMETIEALFPDLAQMLAVPSMFVVFQKELK